MLEKIKEIIEDKLSLDVSDVTMDTKFKEDLGADSLDLYELIMEIESEYSITIAQEDLEKLTTVGAVVNYLTEAGVEV